MTSVTNGGVRYAVQDVRTVDEIDWLCGVRGLQPHESPSAPFVLEASEQTAASIEDQIGAHMHSSNYSESTTRLVAVIVGDAGPSVLYRVSSDGELKHDRTLDFPIVYIEVAGPKALPSERNKFNDNVLMYEPLEVRLKRQQRPWWKFW